MLETVNLDNALAAQDAVSDAAYIFAQTSNGDTVKISKADLASVVAGMIGVASSEKDGLMSRSMAQKSVRVSSQSINKVYEIRFNEESDYGFILISIQHPHYGSATCVFVPRKGGTGVPASVNILGTYRGIFKLYKSSDSVYLKIMNSGADMINIIPLSQRAIKLIDVTDIVDESLLTTI